MDPSETSLEGHACENCGCGLEHGCVCGWCDMTEEDLADLEQYYKELDGE